MKKFPHIVFFLLLWQNLFAEIVGKSVRGRNIEAFVYGKGKETILFVGGIHGDERQGVYLLERFKQIVSQKPSLRKDVRVVIIPRANPDGIKKGTRGNARLVDINRNFPTKNYTTNYQKKAYFPGSRPASEPETRALMKVIKKYKPSLVISLHSQLHCIVAEPDQKELARRIQYYNHYPIVHKLEYETPGSFSDYCLEHGIPTITIEVPNIPHEAIWQQNKKALLEVLLYTPQKEAKNKMILESKTKPTLLEALQRKDWYVWRDKFTNIGEWKKQDKEGNTALHYAIRRGDIPLSLWLIDNHIHINTPNKKGWSPLFEACYFGHTQIVEALLRKGVSPDEKDPYGWTPLIIASQQGHHSIVTLLLEAKAPVNSQDIYGYSALMEAVRRQHASIVEKLLAHGADPNQTNRYGQTASKQAILARSTNAIPLIGGGQ